MSFKNRLALFISVVFISTCALAQTSADTVRVLTYNILNYNGSDRNSYLKTVVNSIDPDVICVQEILSQTGVNSFSANVLDDTYQTITFHDGPDTDNHIFYRSTEFEFVSVQYITTLLRDIAEYEMRVKSSGEIIYFYSMHLKASSGSDNEQKRLAEVEILRQRLDAHPAGTQYIVLGDFNTYSSSEPAYQKLLEQNVSSPGYCVDPINQPGDWHNALSFTAIHTQSPRTEQFGGGANGGLDDRFDFILISSALEDNVLPETYTEYGNDGEHFNLSINLGTNSAVSADIADAIYYASDHLPVYCDFVFVVETTVGTPATSKASIFQLKQNFPNPFNPQTNISFSLPRTSYVLLEVFDILGRKVSTIVDREMPAGAHDVLFDAGKLPASVYFYRMTAEDFTQTRKFILVR